MRFWAIRFLRILINKLSKNKHFYNNPILILKNNLNCLASFYDLWEKLFHFFVSSVLPPTKYMFIVNHACVGTTHKSTIKNILYKSTKHIEKRLSNYLVGSMFIFVNLLELFIVKKKNIFSNLLSMTCASAYVCYICMSIRSQVIWNLLLSNLNKPVLKMWKLNHPFLLACSSIIKNVSTFLRALLS